MRVYCYDGTALVSDLEALYGPRFVGAETVGDYTHLGPSTAAWRNFDPGSFPYERTEGCAFETPAKGWPVVEQKGLFDVV